MTVRHLIGMRNVQLSGTLASVCGFVALLALARALQIEALPTPSVDEPIRYANLQAGARTTNDVIEAAVAAAPFTPDRQAVEAAPVPAAAAEPVVEMILVGTVVEPGGDSFVLVSVGTAPAKVLRVGGELNGHKLRTIAQGSAVFTRNTDGQRLELRVPRSR